MELNSSFYAVPDRTTVHKWVEETPDGFVFDVKAHRLLSRHSAQIESLPPELRDEARRPARGRVTLTPELETALAERLVEETAPLAEAGKLGAYLVQLTPAFGPGRHELDELDGLVAALKPHRVAIELRHRGLGARQAPRVDAALVRRPRRGVRVRRRAAGRALLDHALGPRRGHRRRRSPTCACTGATPTAT